MEKKRFDELNSVNIAYSEQNKSLGYIIKENEEFCPLINGEKKQCYDFAWMEYPSSFSSDGKRFGYIAHKNQKVFMIIDDVGGPPYDRIGAYRLIMMLIAFILVKTAVKLLILRLKTRNIL